jgi:uncharacterized membrane protein YgcG
MKVTKICTRGLLWVIIVMLVMPPGIMAQDSGQTVQPAEFTREELAQMLGPIALYPDSLIAEILMASTYPIEVVEAERWIRQNKNLKGDEIDTALQEKTWDSSVKSLCHFPEVLYAMSDNLERTTRLGDAFLSQQDDVMDTIQELRRKAQEQGNLKTTKEQKVIVEQEIINIEPADQQVIYVPVYDPLYVYGPWWYPAYPPYYWYYPPGEVIASGIIGFGFGIFVGLGIASWCWFDWHHHHIDIDIHKTRHFNRFGRGRWDFDRHVWGHEPDHRRGVAYRERATSQHFGVPASRASEIRPEARGYAGRDFERQTREPLRGNIERQGGLGMTGRRIERETVQRPPTVQRPSTRSNAFSGIGNGNFERRASERGFSSRQSGGFQGGGQGSGFRSGGQGGGFRR